MTEHSSPRAAPAPADAGQIGILLLGMVLVVMTLVLGGVGATAVQLGRIQLLDAADAAALDAADAVDEDTLYTAGLGGGVPLTSSGVRQAAADHLDRRSRPSRIGSWHLGAGTGTPDGRTAVVVLTGEVHIPAASRVLAAFGGSVSITVESRARSEIGSARSRGEGGAVPTASGPSSMTDLHDAPIERSYVTVGYGSETYVPVGRPP